HTGGDPSVVAYVPTVRGRTSAVPPTKGSPERRTREEFDDMLRQNHGNRVVERVAAIVDAATEFGGYATIGSDAHNPRLLINFKTSNVVRALSPFRFNSRSGKITIELRRLADHPAFQDEDRRAEIVSRVSEAIEVPIDAPRLDGFPGFPVDALSKP